MAKKLKDEDLEIKEIVPQSMLVETLRLRNRLAFLEQSVRRSLENGAKVQDGSAEAKLETSVQRRPAWKQVVIERLGKEVADKIIGETPETEIVKMKISVKKGALIKPEDLS